MRFFGDTDVDGSGRITFDELETAIRWGFNHNWKHLLKSVLVEKILFQSDCQLHDIFFAKFMTN